MTNPYPAGSPQALDHWLWQHARDGSGVDAFLQTLQAAATLNDLRDVLQAQATRAGFQTRVTAVGFDRNPLVVEPFPKPKPKRELGDLAIVVTRAERALLRRRMWIVQVKTTTDGWLTKHESVREIELYEHRPEFDLLTATHPQAKSLGRYAPAKDFPRVASDALPFWSYVLLAQAGPDGLPASVPPVRHAWPANPAQAHAGFTDGIVRMLKGVGGAMGCGADVDAQSPHHEWRRLFVALWRNGPWRGAHYATTTAHDDVMTKSGVRFSRTEFSGALAVEDLDRFRKLATADDNATPEEPVIAPGPFDGPPDGPRIPMLLIDQVLGTAR